MAADFSNNSTPPAGDSGPEPARNGRSGLSTFRALRHRNFQLFWTGQLVSLIGTWMQTVAQGWLVKGIVGEHDLSLYLGVVAALGSAPMLLFSLFAGVLADRADKRRILIITQSCAAVLALLLAILTASGRIQLWQIMVLSALLGTVNAFDMPIRQAFVKDMVGPEDLLNA
ncbi:MAG TPA: MFS transporter, partial [Armatimonadota bacterium]